MNELDLRTPDVDGYLPDLSLMGTKWRHSGNQQVYLIFAFVWNCNEDRWAVVHARAGSPIFFTRTVQNFFGLREGVPRYERVPN